MRITITTKIFSGLAFVVLLGLASMSFIYAGLRAVHQAMREFAELKEPVSAAAYEMEINVNGMGFAVLKYLDSHEPRYRRWVEEDKADFETFREAYLRLAKTQEERELARKMGALYSEFQALANALIENGDEQETLFDALAANIEKIDQTLDKEIEPSIARRGVKQPDPFRKAMLAANMEAENSELGNWIRNYQSAPKEQYKKLLFDKLETFRDYLAQFNGLSLSVEERRITGAVERLFDETCTWVQWVVALEDYLVEGSKRFIELRVQMDRLLDGRIQVLALQALTAPRQEADRTVEGVLDAIGYLVALFTLSAFAIGYLRVRGIIRPLNTLMRGTEAIGQRDLSYRIEPLGKDEFGDLARQFNVMMQRLQETTVSKE